MSTGLSGKVKLPIAPATLDWEQARQAQAPGRMVEQLKQGTAGESKTGSASCAGAILGRWYRRPINHRQFGPVLGVLDMRRYSRLLAILSMSCLPAISVGADSDSVKVDFNRDIRPILSETCFACHGPDAAKRKANLRLDTQDGLHGKSGPIVIVAGKPDESDLIERLTTDDMEARMPPASTGKSLTPAQIELFRRWIKQGAEFKGHWAYLPAELPQIPSASAPEFVRNDIDRFILSTLQQKKLLPSPVADKRTLLRRVFFDLTGLPPAPADVAAFLADDSPDAFEKVVDRLLESPQYGERMAMYWLDLVRYADTNGYHGDNHEDRDMYRDYVIEAFNRNKPFDQFTVEQLAGDLLPNPSTEQQIASGYNRLLMTTREGGAQAREYLAKYSADRVRNVSVVWMASTMGCCECHDHKYDPFQARDFYSMAAFFADIQETAVGEQAGTPIPTSEQQSKLDALLADIARTKLQIEQPPFDLIAAQQAWERKTLVELPTLKPAWNIVSPQVAESSAKATLSIQEDSSVLSSGENPAKDTYVITLSSSLSKVTGLRLEALLHPSLNGLSRSNGNFVLTGIEVSVQQPDQKTPVPVKLASAVADFEQPGFPVAHTLDDKADTGWAVAGYEKKENRKAVFLFAQPLNVVPQSTFTVRLKHESVYGQHNIGCFRLAITSAEVPTLDDQGLPQGVLTALKLAPDQRNEGEKKSLSDYYRTIDPKLNELRQTLKSQEAAVVATRNAFRKTLITVAGTPRMIRILPRGNWLDDTGEVVSPAVPGFLGGSAKASDKRQTRLDLARWFTSRENPLVARVFVNRLWKLTFGQGLVKTLDDFGAQGAWPTHPELLDWLALDFVDHGWDIKRTLKQMIMSGTYQQASLVSEELKQQDPFNSWLARQGRFRLDAEMIRDNALATSGLLVQKIGGPSAKPYQPAGYWSYLNFPVREWQNDKQDGLYRRGLYTYWCRTFLYPSLKTFDAPTREECAVDRPRSNTPLQALVLLNDPVYVEASRKFAERILREGGAEINSRLRYAYQQLLSREPRPEEIRILTEIYQKHLEQYQADRTAAEELLKVGVAPVPSGVDVSEMAAITSVARILYNLHETVTRN